jgi:predicted dehydrogenase
MTFEFPSRVRFAHEFQRRLRVALVGCGEQAQRNLLPGMRYAPLEVIATCDVDLTRAEAVGRQLGASRFYSAFDRLLADPELEAVCLATGYKETGEPWYPEQAAAALQSGLHVWMEKPPAASSSAIRELQRLRDQAGRQVAVGFMKIFSASVCKIHQLIGLPEFGRVTTISLRDPEKLPPAERRTDLRSMRFFLDHIVHPASVMQRLVGPVRRLYVEDEPGGGCVIALKFENDAAGVLHMPWGQSGSAPMERLEVVGEGANVVMEANTRITYYRPGHRGIGEYVYGRTADFTTSLDTAPLQWEVDGYSGEPFNMHVFYQGYAPELIYFATTVLAGESIRLGSLEDAFQVMRFFEACQQPSGQSIELSAS